MKTFLRLAASFALCALPALRAAEPAPARVEDIYVSTGDNHWLGGSLPVDSAASIEATFDLFKAMGFRRVYWRGLEEEAWIEVARERPENCRYYSFWKWIRRLYKEVDPDRLAVEAAHKRGMEIWGVSTLVDWGSQADVPPFNDWPFNSESRLRQEHPEWVPVDRQGVLRQGGTIEFAYPEARKALVDLHAKLMRRDKYDGMIFLTYAENHSMRFQDEFGFSEPIVAEFKKRHGIDLRTQDWTRFAGREDWIRLRGEYLTAYLRELKAELAKGGQKLGVVLDPHDLRATEPWNVPELMRTAGSMYQDLETWVQDGIVDQFVVYGYCDPRLQDRALREAVWLTRATGTKVAALTSGPHDERWKPFVAQGVPIVNSISEDIMLFERSHLPFQPVSELRSPDPIRRMRVLSQACAGQSKVPVADLAPLVSDPNVIVRRLALVALGKSKEPGAVPLVEKGLADPENGVRCMAAHALEFNQRPESVAALLAAVEKHANHPLVESAIASLSRFKPAPVAALVQALSSSKSGAVRTVAARVLVNLAREEQLPALVAALGDPEPFVRFSAAEALGNLRESPKAVEALLEATRHADPVASDRAATSLGAAMARSEKSTLPLRPRVVAALRDLYAKLGDGCKRVDAEWGYRPVGNALLACGPEGEAALREFLQQGKDVRLAEQAWKSLWIRQRPSSFSEVTEKENAEAFRHRPRSLRKVEAPRLANGFEDTSTYRPDVTGMTGDSAKVTGRWGPFATNGPLVDSGDAAEGKQSLKLVRGGGAVYGQVSPGVRKGNDGEVRFWVKREAADSSFVVAVKGFDQAYVQQMGALVGPEGKVLLRDEAKQAWVDSGLLIPKGEWARVTLATRRASGTYSVAVAPKGGARKASAVEVPMRQVGDTQIVEFTPQPPDTAHVTRLDDIQMLEMP